MNLYIGNLSYNVKESDLRNVMDADHSHPFKRHGCDCYDQEEQPD